MKESTKLFRIFVVLIFCTALTSCKYVNILRLINDYRRVSPKEWAEYKIVEQKQKEADRKIDSILYYTESMSSERTEAVKCIYRDRSVFKAREDSLMFIMVRAQLDKLEGRRQPLHSRNMRKLHFLSEFIYTYPEIYGSLRERAVALYERLGDKRKESPKGREISLFLNPLTEVRVGDRMSDATLPDLEGNTHKLSDYLGKNKYLLLDFWTSWCSPCIEFIPVYKALHEEHGDNVTIIGINLDDNTTAWERSSFEHGITWLNLHAPALGELTNSYRINSYPRAVFIDSDGTVLAIDHPGSIVDFEYSSKILNK